MTFHFCTSLFKTNYFHANVVQEFTKSSNLEEKYLFKDKKIENFSIKSQIFYNESCKIPILELNGHDKSEPVKTCSQTKDWGYLVNNIWYFDSFVKPGLHHYRCQYRFLIRIDDFKFSYSNPIILKDAQIIKEEVFEVSCFSKSNYNAYNGLFAQIVKKFDDQITNNDNFNKSRPLNIILMSFDSVSRVSWLKRLQKTNKFIFEVMKFELLKG